MKKVVFLLIIAILGFCIPPAYAVNPISGYRFAFLNHPQREFTEEESQYIATHYDLAVIGFQSDPMIASGKRIKEINPNIKLFVYFPTSIRQVGARYGQEVFKEEWYLHDFSGNRIKKGLENSNLEYIDLTNEDYTQWARETILGFVPQVPYDGVVYDNANPVGVGSSNWLDVLTQEKINSWNESQVQYLRNMTTNLNSRNKILIFNGIHRARAKINRTLSYLDFTNGALNERFCYIQDNNGVYGLGSKELQLEDIDLEQQIGNRQKFVLQKVNWEGKLDTLPATEQKRLGNYCFGIFLMGHVPGYTFFKFGDGYNLIKEPQEYKTNAEAIDIPLGMPIANYTNDKGLLSRKFQNGFAVVNLNTTESNWKAPVSLRQFISPAQYNAISANQVIPVSPESARFFTLPESSSPTPTPKGSVTPTSIQNEVSADITLTGNSAGDRVNQRDADQLIANFGKMGNKGWIKEDINKDGKVDIFDYNILIEQESL